MSKELKSDEIEDIFYYSNDNGKEIKCPKIRIGIIKVAKYIQKTFKLIF
jgi:hypothetical protein